MPDAQIIAVADPAESFSLEKFYYKGMGGRLPVEGADRETLRREDAELSLADYVDFRDMLEKEKAIDAVLIATPDHLHAYAVGHRRCAPASTSIARSRSRTTSGRRATSAKVAADTGVATQLGSQGHSSPGTRETIECIQDGAIGAVREIHVWVGAKRWNPTLTGKPTDTPPVPAGLNWDLWLGPRERTAIPSRLLPGGLARLLGLWLDWDRRLWLP